MSGRSVPGALIRFGLFEFDSLTGELRKKGIKTRLQGQPLEILSMLLARPGKVVTREELQTRLWPADTFVAFDRSLNAAVKRLRAALGDSAETPRFIETLARRGYRFIAPVDAPQSATAESLLPAASPSRRPRYFVLPILAAMALLASATALYMSKVVDAPGRGSPSKRKESLLVLPLKSLSGDPE